MNIYIKIILAYLKIGLFGFGGGYAVKYLLGQDAVPVEGGAGSQQWSLDTSGTVRDALGFASST